MNKKIWYFLGKKMLQKMMRKINQKSVFENSHKLLCVRVTPPFYIWCVPALLGGKAAIFWLEKSALPLDSFYLPLAHHTPGHSAPPPLLPLSPPSPG